MSDAGSFSTSITAFGAGVLSVLSPCVMPLMPAYLSLVSGISVEELREQSADHGVRRRTLLACLGFVLGFSAVFVVLGATATLVGRALRTWRGEILGIEFGLSQVAGLVIIIFGLHLAGVLRIPFLYREKRVQVERQPAGPLGAALVGAAFAFGWSPCVGPILGGILTLAGSRDTVAQGVWLLSVYSAGLGLPFLLAGWSLDRFLRAFQLLRRHFRKIELASGGLLVAVGLLVLTDQLTRLNGYFRFLNEIVLALEEALL